MTEIPGWFDDAEGDDGEVQVSWNPRAEPAAFRELETRWGARVLQESEGRTESYTTASARDDVAGGKLTPLLAPAVAAEQNPNMLTVDVNLIGASYTARLAFYHLKRNPGIEKSIVLLGSMCEWLATAL